MSSISATHHRCGRDCLLLLVDYRRIIIAICHIASHLGIGVSYSVYYRWHIRCCKNRYCS